MPSPSTGCSALGLTIIVSVAWLPRGLIGVGDVWRTRMQRRAAVRPDMSEPVLRARDLTRRFGGLVAVDRVSLELHRGSVHAVIGTNGAGKSTLINMLAGELAASSGTVELHGHDVTRWPQPKRARAGIGRSYQRTTLFMQFSVLENCRLAAQAHHQKPWSLWSSAAACPVAMPAAREAAARAGLADVLDTPRVRVVARPAPPARDRDVPGHRSPKCCCSTSRWPAWAPRRPIACSRCSPS